MPPTLARLIRLYLWNVRSNRDGSEERPVVLAEDATVRCREAPLVEAELLRLFGERAEAAVRLAYHLTGDREAALDISQEAFVRAMESLPTLEDPARAGAWFSRIVLNLSRDWLRRRASECSARRAASPRLTAGDADPALHAEREEARERLRAALLALPEELREAVSLVCVEGLAPKEAAEALGVVAGTLRWRLHEGRKLLREAF